MLVNLDGYQDMPYVSVNLKTRRDGSKDVTNRWGVGIMFGVVMLNQVFSVDVTLLKRCLVTCIDF